MVEHMRYTRSSCKTAVQELFFFLLRTRLPRQVQRGLSCTPLLPYQAGPCSRSALGALYLSHSASQGLPLRRGGADGWMDGGGGGALGGGLLCCMCRSLCVHCHIPLPPFQLGKGGGGGGGCCPITPPRKDGLGSRCAVAVPECPEHLYCALLSAQERQCVPLQKPMGGHAAPIRRPLWCGNHQHFPRPSPLKCREVSSPACALCAQCVFQCLLVVPCLRDGGKCECVGRTIR